MPAASAKTGVYEDHDISNSDKTNFVECTLPSVPSVAIHIVPCSQHTPERALLFDL